MWRDTLGQSAVVVGVGSKIQRMWTFKSSRSSSVTASSEGSGAGSGNGSTGSFNAQSKKKKEALSPAQKRSRRLRLIFFGHVIVYSIAGIALDSNYEVGASNPGMAHTITEVPVPWCLIHAIIIGSVMSPAAILVPAMWLGLLPDRLMGKSPGLKKFKRFWTRFAQFSTWFTDIVWIVIGFLPLADPKLGLASIHGCLIGIIIFCIPAQVIVTLVATKTFALAMQNPPSSFFGQLFALAFSRKRFKALPENMKKVAMKLRLSIYIVNGIAGAASVGSILLIAPTWFATRPDIFESLVLVIAASCFECFSIYLFKAPYPKKKNSAKGADSGGGSTGSGTSQEGSREGTPKAGHSARRGLNVRRKSLAAPVPAERSGSGGIFLEVVTVTAVLLLAGLLGVLCFPILIMASLLRFLAFSCDRFRRDPSDINICIIGMGWTGVQAAARLKQLGVERVRCFEANDDVGGTWHPSKRYHALYIHTPIWASSFHKFPYKTSKAVVHKRLDGKSLQRYISKYADTEGVRPWIEFNRQVKNIDFSSESGTASVTTVDVKTGAWYEEGPFDLVLYTGFASTPFVPNLPGAEQFQGAAMHSTSLHSDVFKGMIDSKEPKHVVIVGGGKSACDTIVNFIEAADNGSNIKHTWLYRRPYQYMKFERFFHRTEKIKGKCRCCTRFCVMMRALSFMIMIVLTGIAPALAWRLMTWIGYTWSYKKNSSHKTFHLGMLNRVERYLLENKTNQVQGNPVAFTPKGLKLESGQEIECDVVIFCTGYRTGVREMQLNKDGEQYQLSNNTRLFEHIIVPDFPVFANLTTFTTAPGPTRGYNAAEYAVYHLCVRKPLSQATLRKRTRGLWAKQTLDRHFLLSETFLMSWVRLYVDFLTRGLLQWHSWLLFWVKALVLQNGNAMETIHMPLLPRQRGSSKPAGKKSTDPRNLYMRQRKNADGGDDSSLEVQTVEVKPKKVDVGNDGGDGDEASGNRIPSETQSGI
eukprot:g2759.t1